MTRTELTVRYGSFAALAVLSNLLAQELSLRLYGGIYSLYVSIGAGTVVGLICKYELDKRYIFAQAAPSGRRDLQRFLAYTLTGVLTTALFWGFELGFEFLFASKTARYTGAVIGLSLGYALKYQLDKRCVFTQQEPTWN